jgi:ABC-type lipoprotein export system ATPase subunit
MKNRENILKAFKMRWEGKSLSQIEKATNIKRPYVSFLFQNFDLTEIEQIAKNQNLMKELKEKDKNIKELKEKLEECKNCTCWEKLNFFEKLELAGKFVLIGIVVSGILFLIAFYLYLKIF